MPRSAVAAAILLLGLVPHHSLSSQAAPARDPLVGLWGGGEMALAATVQGAVTVERTANSWTMRVGGFEAHAPASGDSLVLRLPGGQGSLRAQIHGDSLEGYWIQPAAFGSPSYASPVRFHSRAAGAWDGTVTPLIQRFPLYLAIRRLDDGELRGTFRNPEANWPGRAGAMRILREGSEVLFFDVRTGKSRYRQPFDSAAGTLLFDFGAPLVLTRRSDDDAVGFFPRAPALPPYTYRQPGRGVDGWRTASAASARVREASLELIVRQIASADPLTDSLPRVHALLVARHGTLVLDEYFHGYSEDRPHDLRSASKTMTSIMLGAAMYRGAPLSIGSPIDAAQPHTGITIGHLLTHSSGLACDDDDDNSPGNEDRMQSQPETDWYRYTLSLARIHSPGRVYAYCSGGVNLVGRAIGMATHTWLPAEFDRHVARPLQITNYAMNLMPSGEMYAAGGMHMRPRDFLKFGQLYLNGGIWSGRRIVSRQWVTLTTARQIDRPDGSSDGYGWHRHTLRVAGRQYETFEASGNGGQFVIVVPQLDLVVAATAGNYGQYAVWQRIRTELVPQVIAAAR